MPCQRGIYQDGMLKNPANLRNLTPNQLARADNVATWEAFRFHAAWVNWTKWVTTLTATIWNDFPHLRIKDIQILFLKMILCLFQTWGKQHVKHFAFVDYIVLQRVLVIASEGHKNFDYFGSMKCHLVALYHQQVSITRWNFQSPAAGCRFIVSHWRGRNGMAHQKRRRRACH